ncbi:MAG: sugar phosphate isomerase/epimerase family protein [Candidatus Firestonebacteria bacterium]
MKKTINYWMFPGGLDGKVKVSDALSMAKKFGYEAIELCFADSGEVSQETTKAQAESMLAEAKKTGIEVVSLCTGIYWGYNFGSSKQSDRDKAVKATEKYLELASWLKVDSILVVPGAVDVFFNPAAEVNSYDDVYSRSVECLKKLLPTAEKFKVSIAIENVWNRFIMSPLEMNSYVDSFKSKYIGVYFDVGNVIPFGYPQQWIKILGSRIKKIHFKDFKFAAGNGGGLGFVDLLDGDVNWPEVMKALKEIGYDGPVTAELIPYYNHHPLARCEVASIAMDYILGRK